MSTKASVVDSEEVHSTCIVRRIDCREACCSYIEVLGAEEVAIWDD